MEAMTDILSQELKNLNIIVNSINPGGTATKMRKEAYPDEDQSQLPTPSDILPIFLYLASDDAQETGMKYNAREYIGSL
jgi:NAD(P)-dependent dehydrogenase (short-subunit alcohol dehydrogenase family)